MTRRTVVVLGASGQIGVFLVPRLVSANFLVLAVSRNPKPEWYPELPDVQWIKWDSMLADPETQADFLVSAGPVAAVLKMVGKCHHLQRAVVFSTSSVFSKLDSNDRWEKDQIRQILTDEAQLSTACASRGVSLSMLRPTLIYGCGLDGNVSWLARWIRRFGFVPVSSHATGLRQPVHADDLAQAAVAVLAAEKPLSLDEPLCGGSTLSFRHMIEQIFSGMNKPVRIVKIPKTLFVMAIFFVRLIPGLRGIRSEMVRRQAVDLVFDDTVARKCLGYAPRKFEPGPQEFSLPDQARLRALAVR